MYVITDSCNGYAQSIALNRMLVAFQQPTNSNMVDYHTLVVDHVMNNLNLTGHVTKSATSSFAYGGNADVWKGLWLNKTSGTTIEVAAKVLKGNEDAVVHRRLLRETRIWATVKHPHIVPFFGISFDFDQPRRPCLIAPFYRHGNIQHYLKDHPNICKLSLIVQIAGALSYLHDAAIIHADVKAANILIDDKGDACLADFGQSRILHTSGFTTKVTAGTWRFMAPELIETRADEGDGGVLCATMATDVWAFAMTVIEIYTGCLPFSQYRNDASVVFAVMKGARPKRTHCPQIGDEVWKMLERCWEDADQRPCMAVLFDFFKLQLASLTPQPALL